MATPLTTTVALDALRRDMTTHGLCATQGPDDERWMPEVGRPRTPGQRERLVAHARAACVGCPVLAQCRRWALETGQQHGTWGGLAEHELAAHRRARRPTQNVPAAVAA